MGWGVGGERENSLCCVQPDVKGWLFFLRCIFSNCFFNKWDERAADVAPFCYLFHREGSLPTAFHGFSLAVILYYLPDKMPSLKEETSLNFSSGSLIYQ